ncbi:MAG: glycine cleavage system protein T, partial [Phycisphaerae bacterium]|nr:glycine cleavage system protein T [Phycisphaerae bacterium]
KNFGMMAVGALVDKAAELGIALKPAGLGARDTLRLEAGMPLYGHELSEDWDPISGGQQWCCYLEKDFIGSEVVKKMAAKPERLIAGFELEGKRIAREGAEVFADGEKVGFVTSGTHSPTFDRVIAMGLVKAAIAEPGQTVEIDIRGKRTPAKTVKLPFYKRGK